MDNLPTELLSQILTHLPLPTIFSLRRVSHRWKETASAAFATRLRSLYSLPSKSTSKPNPKPLLTLEIALLTTTHHSRNHNPLFADGGKGLVDWKQVELGIKNVDSDRGVIVLEPSGKGGVVLSRDAGIGRFGWCVKGVARFCGWKGELVRCDEGAGIALGDEYLNTGEQGKTTDASVKGARGCSKPFTLVAPDMEVPSLSDLARIDHILTPNGYFLPQTDKDAISISDSIASTTLTSYEMSLSYTTFDLGLAPDSSNPTSPPLTTSLHTTPTSSLLITPQTLTISYTYLFTLLSHPSHPPNPTTLVSIFPPKRTSKLLQCARKTGLKWDEKYWSFDVVLGWLSGSYSDSNGKDDDVDPAVVVEYLVEWEKVMECRKWRGVGKSNGGRFLRVPA